MTSKQLKYGLTNTTSGNLNKKQLQNKYKQIDVDDFDIQMISKEFLQNKTLKKPLKQYQIQLDKTNSYWIKPQNDKTQKNKFQYNHSENIFKNKIEDQDVNLKKTQKFDYTYISYNQNIKPAYKPIQNNFVQNVDNNKINNNDEDAFSLNDNNTIFSAMMKKGLKNKKTITFIENIKQKQTNIKVTINQPVRQVGKAQSKLKQLFNKINKPVNEQKNTKKLSIPYINNNEDIQQDIQQSINEYDEQFQQYSQGSAIKQSIRESIGYTSSAGKALKSQIIQQIQQSIRGSLSASKQQIQQFIASYKSSNVGIKQQINQSLSGSKKSKQEQVYQEIFQEYQDQLSHSRSGFKKSSFKDSNDQFSRSFRKKTNVIKSIKLAEEINVNKIAENQDKNNILADNLNIEKKSLLERKANLQKLLKKKQLPYNIPDKNKNLFYEFKIQINKLLTSQNFQSKLKKLTSFINTDDNNGSINLLEDKILKNIMQSIQKLKKPQIGVNEIQKLREQYDYKLATLLKDQQINLKVQMDRKLHEKDLQYKKMIAQLQQRFQGKAFSSTKMSNFISQSNYNNGGYDLDSDYSIDSDNISWKADLWEVLPENQKRKLYQKQTKQVTNFLTQIMMNQLKQESLNRSLDISFEFPDDINQRNNSNISNASSNKNNSNNLPSVKSYKKFTQDQFAMPKSAFNRKQIQQNISMPSSSTSSKKQSIFPDFPRPKPKVQQIISIPSHKQNVNQYSKIQGQIPVEPTKKDLFIKQKIMQILSKYKSSYLRKKNDVIRKVLKSLKPKDSKKIPQQNLLSIVQQITILPKQDIHPDELLYVRCYQQQLIWSLVHLITKNETKKLQLIQQQMRKQYDRLVVVCQIKTVEQCQEKVTLDLYQDKSYSYMKNNINVMMMKPCPLEISFKDEAIEMLEVKQERKVKDQIVEEIMKSLMTEFSKEFPKRKK